MKNFDDIYNELSSSERFKEYFGTNKADFENFVNSSTEADELIKNEFGVENITEAFKKKSTASPTNLEEESFSLQSPSVGQTEEVVDQPEMGMVSNGAPVAGPGPQASAIIKVTGKVKPQPELGLNQPFFRLRTSFQKTYRDIETNLSREDSNLGLLQSQLNNLVRDFKEFAPEENISSDFNTIVKRVSEKYGVDVKPTGITIKYKTAPNLAPGGILLTPKVFQEEMKKEAARIEQEKEIEKTYTIIDGKKYKRDEGLGVFVPVVEPISLDDKQKTAIDYMVESEKGGSVYERGADKSASERLIALIKPDIETFVLKVESNVPANFFYEADPEKRQLSYAYGPYMFTKRGLEDAFTNFGGAKLKGGVLPSVNPNWVDDEAEKYVLKSGIVTDELVKDYNDYANSLGMMLITKEGVVEKLKQQVARLITSELEAQIRVRATEKKLADGGVFQDELGKKETEKLKLLYSTQEAKLKSFDLEQKNEYDNFFEALQDEAKSKGLELRKEYEDAVNSGLLSKEEQDQAYEKFTENVNALISETEAKRIARVEELKKKREAYVLDIKQKRKAEADALTANIKAQGAEYKKQFENAWDEVTKEDKEYDPRSLVSQLSYGFTSEFTNSLKEISNYLTATYGIEMNPLQGFVPVLETMATSSAVEAKDLGKLDFFSGEYFRNAAISIANMSGRMVVPIVATVLSKNPYVGGTIGWAMDTASQVSQNYDEIFKKTGSVVEAENAAAETLKTQILIAPSYALEMLPFVQGVLTKAAKGTGLFGFTKKFLASAGIEILNETYFQELVANYTRDKLVGGENFKQSFIQYVLENQKNVLLNVAPSAGFFGATSAAKEVVAESRYNTALEEVKTKLGELGLTQSLTTAVNVLGSNGIHFIPEYWYTSGLITDKDLVAKMKLVIKDVVEGVKSSEGVIRDVDQQKYYASLFAKRSKLERIIAQTTSEAAKELLKGAADELDTKIKNVALGKDKRYTKITLGNNNTFIVDNDEMQNFARDKNFLTNLIDGKAKIETEDSKVLATFDEAKKRYQQEEQQIQEAGTVGPQTVGGVSTQSAVDRGATIDQADKVQQVVDKANTNRQAKDAQAIVDQAKQGQAVLEQLSPGVKIVLMNEQEFNDHVTQVGGVAGSSGNIQISRKDGQLQAEIQINVDRANSTTVNHEIAHVALINTIGTDQKLMDEMVKSLEGVISKTYGEGDTGVLNTLKEFIGGYNRAVKGEEFLVQLASEMANLNKDMSLGLMQQIAKAISDFVSKVTNGKVQLFESINKRQDFVDFMNGLAQTLRTGQVAQSIQAKQAGPTTEVGPQTTPQATPQVTPQVTPETTAQTRVADISKAQENQTSQDITNENQRGLQQTRDRGGRIESRKNAPLEGAPSVPGINGPDPQLVAVAERYARENGINLKRQSEYVTIDPQFSKRIADAYAEMRHDPANPKVKEAYQNLIQQTTAQYQSLVDAGYKFWFIDGNIPSNAEYATSPYNALRDLRQNKQMGVFPTTDGYGADLSDLPVADNPMLVNTGLMWPVGDLNGTMKPVLANDLFRAVHDTFGHGLEGAGFRARGEENAWQAHVRLFTGSAVGAITSETRGQNSWLNFGPYGEQNRHSKVENTIFADQKIGLMPEWTWTERRAGDFVDNTKIEEQNIQRDKTQNAISKSQDIVFDRETKNLTFEGKEVGIPLAVKQSLNTIPNALQFASESALPTNLLFKRELQKRFVQDLTNLKKHYGAKFNPTKQNDLLKKYLVDAYIYETLIAMKSFPDALGWYDAKTKAAMEIMSLVHPEIATDPVSAGIFKIAVAVTSNGNKVTDNFFEADRQYKYFKDNGKFDEDKSIGTQSSGIKSTFKLTNEILTKISKEDFIKFLTSKVRAGDLKYKGKDGKLKNLLSGFTVDTEVFGASIFGPKIGNGFFMNLYGDFTQLTMDRWFMRQYGRLTGTLIKISPQKIQESKVRLKNALKDLSKQEKSILESLIPGYKTLSLEDLGKKIYKISAKKNIREQLQSTDNLDEVRKAGKTLDGNIKGEKEAPGGGKERAFIISVFDDIQRKLKEEYGLDITIADLQAVNWYPEKALYQTFQEGKTEELGAEETSDNEQPDYESAAKKLAASYGFTNEQITDKLTDTNGRPKFDTGRNQQPGRDHSDIGVELITEQILGVKSSLASKSKKKSTQTISKSQLDYQNIFNNYPKLSKIGTPEQYSRYLNTIFPDTKQRGVFYHKTMAARVPKDGKFKGYVTYFSSDKDYKPLGLVADVTIPVVLNIKNPLYAENELFDAPEEVHRKGEYTAPRIVKGDNLGYDSVIGKDAGQQKGYTIAVFEPEQIHLIGTAKDESAFRRFVIADKVKSVGRFVSELVVRSRKIANSPENLRLANENFGVEDGKANTISKAQYNPTQLRELSKTLSVKFDQAQLEQFRGLINENVTEPQNTLKAYKLFRVKRNFPGELFPLFVGANESVVMGEWTAAKVGELTQTKEGKTMVKSTLGPLAYRPGWHSGELAVATHIGAKKNSTDKAPSLRADDQVWAEVEVGNDVDWQTEANNRAEKTKDGRVVERTAHITDQVPTGGSYKYKTNPNMTGSWIISGEMKVNRILTDAEVEQINNEAGTKDLPRAKPFDFAAYGFNPDGTASDPKQALSNQIARAYLNAKETGTNQELVDAVDGKSKTISKSQLNYQNIFNEYEAVLNSTGDKVAAMDALLQTGYSKMRIKEQLGGRFDEAAYNDAHIARAKTTMQQVSDVFERRNQEIKDRINANLRQIDLIYEDLIADGYYPLEIFRAAYEMDFMSPQDLENIFGAEYRQTIKTALNQDDYPAEFLDELGSDPQSIKIEQKAADILDIVGQTGIGLVDAKVAMDAFLDYLKENGFDAIAVTLRSELGKAKFEQQTDPNATWDAFASAFKTGSELFSMAGRVLQLARFFNERSTLSLIERSLEAEGVQLTDKQRETLTSLVNDNLNAEKVRKEKLKELESDWSDNAYDAYLNAEKAHGLSIIRVAQFLDARKPGLWNERVTSGGSRALLGVTTTVLSFVANVENNLITSNYVTRFIQKMRDSIGSGIRGNTLSYENWKMARDLAKPRFRYQQMHAFKYGALNTTNGLNNYYDNLAQVNFFKDPQFVYKFANTMVKKTSGKFMWQMTPEEAADALNLTLIKLADGTLELRDGKTYSMARSMAWSIGIGVGTSLATGKPSMLLTSFGPQIAEGVGRAMAFGGDMAFGQSAAQRAMIDYFSNIQGTRFQDGVFNTLIKDANGNLDKNALRALSTILFNSPELYAKFEEEGLKRTLLADNIISSGISRLRGGIRKRVKELYVKNRLQPRRFKTGVSLIDETFRQATLSGFKKNLYQLGDVALWTLMPFTKVPVNFLGSALAKTIPAVAVPKYLYSELSYQVANHKFDEKYPKNVQLKSERQKLEYEKAKIDLFRQKRQVTFDAAQMITSMAFYALATSIAKAGALLVPGDDEKDKALKEANARSGRFNISLYFDYLKSMATLKGTDNFLARRGGDLVPGDVTVNIANFGFLGYALGLYGAVYEKKREKEQNLMVQLLDDQVNGLLLTLQLSIGSGIQNLPMFQGLARVGQVMNDLKADDPEAGKKAFENYMSSTLATTAAVFFPSFNSFVSKGNAEFVQNPNDIFPIREGDTWPATWGKIGIKTIQKLNRNFSFNEDTRNEYYKEAIGPFGENLYNKVTLAEPGTAGAYFQAIIDPFGFSLYSIPVKEQVKDKEKAIASMTMVSKMIDMATAYQQMTGRDYQWKWNGKESSMFQVISNPMKNTFTWSQSITTGGEDRPDSPNYLVYQLPNDLYRKELQSRGEKMFKVLRGFAQEADSDMAKVRSFVEEGKMREAEETITNYFKRYEDAQQQAQISYLSEYRIEREKQYLIEMKRRGLITPNMMEKMIKMGLADTNGNIP